jgi:hypothetical protein
MKPRFFILKIQVLRSQRFSTENQFFGGLVRPCPQIYPNVFFLCRHGFCSLFLLIFPQNGVPVLLYFKGESEQSRA